MEQRLTETQLNRAIAELASRLSLVDSFLRILVEAAVCSPGTGPTFDPAPILREARRGGVRLEAEKQRRYEWRRRERFIRRFDEKDYRVTNRPQPDWLFSTPRMAVIVENKIDDRPGLQNQQLVTYGNLLRRHEDFKTLRHGLIIVTRILLPVEWLGLRRIKDMFLGQVLWNEILDQMRNIAPQSGRDRESWLELLERAAGTAAPAASDLDR